MVAPDLSSKELGKRTEWPKKGVNLGSKNLSNNILNLCKYTLLKTKTYANILHLLMRLYLRLQRAQTNPKVHHIKHVLRYWFKLRPRSFWLERLGTRPVPPGSIWPDSKSARTRNIVVRLDTARNEKVSIRAFLSPSRPEMEMDHRMSRMKTDQI